MTPFQSIPRRPMPNGLYMVSILVVGTLFLLAVVFGWRIKQGAKPGSALNTSESMSTVPDWGFDWYGQDPNSRSTALQRGQVLDERLGVSADAIALRRIVEIYQWSEEFIGDTATRESVSSDTGNQVTVNLGAVISGASDSGPVAQNLAFLNTLPPASVPSDTAGSVAATDSTDSPKAAIVSVTNRQKDNRGLENSRLGATSASTHTNIRYRKTWSDRLIDSTQFVQSEGHVNPEVKLFANELFVNETLIRQWFEQPICNLQLPIIGYRPYPVPDEYYDRAPMRHVMHIQLIDGVLFFGKGSLEQPQIGDIRIRYEIFAPQAPRVY